MFAAQIKTSDNKLQESTDRVEQLQSKFAYKQYICFW